MQINLQVLRTDMIWVFPLTFILVNQRAITGGLLQVSPCFCGHSIAGAIKGYAQDWIGLYREYLRLFLSASFFGKRLSAAPQVSIKDGYAAVVGIVGTF